jgi:hypothetical protein
MAGLQEAQGGHTPARVVRPVYERLDENGPGRVGSRRARGAVARVTSRAFRRVAVRVLLQERHTVGHPLRGGRALWLAPGSTWYAIHFESGDNVLPVACSSVMCLLVSSFSRCNTGFASAGLPA